MFTYLLARPIELRSYAKRKGPNGNVGLEILPRKNLSQPGLRYLRRVVFPMSPLGGKSKQWAEPNTSTLRDSLRPEENLMSANPCATPRRVAPFVLARYRCPATAQRSYPCIRYFTYLCSGWAGSTVPSPAGPSRKRRAKPTYRAEKQGASPISRYYEILFLRKRISCPPTLALPPPSSPLGLVHYPVRSLATRVYERSC